MNHESRTRLFAYLEQGRAASIQQIRDLVGKDASVLEPVIQGNFVDSALHFAIRQECSEEVLLYLLQCTYPSDHPKDVDDSCWKLTLLSALDASRNISSRVIFALLDAFPGWLQCKEFCSPYGHLFYWILAVRSDIARGMVERNPELAALRSQTLCYPIHVAAELHDRATAEVLLNAFPEGLMKRDADGRFPLHLILQKQPRSLERRDDLDLLRYLATQMDPSAFAAEPGRTTFLHDIAIRDCKFNMDELKTQAIIDLNPQAVLTADKNGNLPIHLALTDDTEAFDFIRALLVAGPASLRRADRSGMLPLHMAVGKYMVNTVYEMIQMHPDAIIAKDDRGQTPLHVMLEMDMFDDNNTECMIDLHPEVLVMQDAAGKVPLHYLMRNCAYYEEFDWQQAVDLLATKCPAAARICDHDGKTPIHYAATHAVPFAIFETLVGQCPTAVYAQDSEGNIPLVYAASATNSVDEQESLSTIYLLVRHNPIKIVGFQHREEVEQEGSSGNAGRKRKRGDN